jgi:hypothetical protein
VIAFRLEREPLGVLWLLPLQQIVYRKLMNTVRIPLVVTAAGGFRLGVAEAEVCWWVEVHLAAAPVTGTAAASPQRSPDLIHRP